MNNGLVAAFGIAAAILDIVGLYPYVRDIFRHKTKPERAMWWIYAVLFFLLFAAQASAGARWLLLVSATYVVSSVLAAVLSVRYGYGSFHRRDYLSILMALAGLGVWLFTDRPLLAIIMIIIVDFAGFWLTLVKTWHAPHTETLISWQLSVGSALLSVFAVGSWNLTVLIYPVYAVLATGLLVFIIMYRRTKVKADPKDF